MIAALPIASLMLAASAPASHAQSGPQAVKVEVAPASPDDVHEAIDACISITAANWLDIDALKRRLGWQNSITAADNGDKEPTGGVFRKPGNEALIIITRGELLDRRCRIGARLAQSSDYHSLAGATSQWLGAPQSRMGSRYTWRLGPATVLMTPSRSKNEANAEFSITSSQRNKDKQ